MDFNYVMWLVCSTLLWMLTMEHVVDAKTRDERSRPKLKNPLKSSKSKLLSSFSSTSIPSSSRKPKTCCENGGLCVMGVFCHCPENFYGFRCEHGMRSCGPLKHELWARLGCNMCQCYDSELYCISYAYSGCDDKPEKEDIKISDYEDDMYIFPELETTTSSYDYYYDDYYGEDDDDDESNDNTSSQPSLHSFCASNRAIILLSLTVFVNMLSSQMILDTLDS